VASSHGQLWLAVAGGAGQQVPVRAAGYRPEGGATVIGQETLKGRLQM
jgi:hypothetical protein